MDDQPLLVVERQEFRKLINYLRYDTNIPSDDTLRRELDINFSTMKERVRRQLQASFPLLVSKI
jgi:hypothetical protein